MLQRFAPLPVSPPRVAALNRGPLGPRFRVRGLLGHRGLATWIEQATATIGPVRASASSGIVRVNTGLSGRVVDWATELERCVAAFDAVEFPPRERATVRRRAPPQRAPAAARAAGELRGIPAAPEGAVAAASKPFHAWPTKALLQRLVATSAGLSSAEAGARLARDGVNELRDITARSDAEILLSQFKSVPVALLAGSGALALALASRAIGDAAAIGAVLAVNGGIGYATERQAEQTVSALRKLAPQSTVVLRDRSEIVIPTREVVAGDVLVLKPGLPVAADARVIESHRLSANEAPLTGESLPVRKEPVETLPLDTPVGERRSLLHMGTVISGGTGRAIVVATGERTVLGRIRALAQTAEAPRTRMQTELDGLGKRLAVGASALCLGVFGIGLARGRPALPMLRTAVALGVAAIPEGLPTVATSLIAAGIRTLQKRDVYARRMDAIENLGAVDVVGFDKTGTLTQNRMAVAAVSIGSPAIP